MEILDIVDARGVPTGKTAERGTVHANGLMHRTSHVWLLRKKNSVTEILLQKRSSVKGAFPGCYDISSAGHIPAGDDFAESALRELREELGISVAPDELVFCGDRMVVWDAEFHGKPFHDRQYSRVFLLWHDREAADFVLQKEEVESVRWMPLEECLAAVRENTVPHCIHLEELDMVKAAITK